MTTQLPKGRSEAETVIEEVKDFIQHGERELAGQGLFYHSLQGSSDRSQDAFFQYGPTSEAIMYRGTCMGRSIEHEVSMRLKYK